MINHPLSVHIRAEPPPPPHTHTHTAFFQNPSERESLKFLTDIVKIRVKNYFSEKTTLPKNLLQKHEN